MSDYLKHADTQYSERILECHQLALESMDRGDLPFGALIELNGDVIARGYNTGKTDITGHAEINAIRNFLEHHPIGQLKQCVLYSNFEPCAMCSFLIRDYGIPKVVFSIHSPHLGGMSKWSILKDTIEPAFTWQGLPVEPIVIGGILESECCKLFDSLQWKMHHYS